MRRVLFVVFLLSGVWLGAQDLDSTIVVIQAGDTLIRYHYSVFDYGAINEALPEEIPEPAAIPMGDDIRRSADLSWRHERRPKIPIPGSIVGEIPYTEGNTPSGGKTITVPILQAANAPCPQIALSYSSQAGNGEAGYGWSISGLSSIRCVAACAHFDGTPSPAHPSEGPFALDGVRLISNTDSRMSDYQWITSTGFIYVKEVRLGGELRAFEASCPDGSMMRFGWTDSETEKTSYPLTYVKYRDGFRVRIEYLSNQNTFYPTRIQYGSVSGNYPCEIQFSYGGRSDIETGYYCGMEARREKVLTSIDSKEGGQVLRHYGLTHEDNGRAYTLVKLNCSVGASAYYPLVFDYGDNSYPDSFSNDGRRVQLMGNALADPCVKRGRFIRGQASDGLIVMPEYSIPYGLLINNGVASFGSLIPEMQKILIAPTVSLGQNTSEIYAGEGFQTIDAIDVDGNGIDEIVKINLVAASSTTTRMQIDTYTFRSPSMSGSGLSITGSKSLYLGGMVTQGNIHGPRWRKYYYGDFRGDGKTMLLSIVLKSSQFSKC